MNQHRLDKLDRTRKGQRAASLLRCTTLSKDLVNSDSERYYM